MKTPGDTTHDPRHVAYVRRWAALGTELEKIRENEIREADTQAAIRMLDSAFKMALRNLPPRQTSGIVEWQDMVRRWRDRG